MKSFIKPNRTDSILLAVAASFIFAGTVGCESKEAGKVTAPSETAQTANAGAAVANTVAPVPPTRGAEQSAPMAPVNGDPRANAPTPDKIANAPK